AVPCGDAFVCVGQDGDAYCGREDDLAATAIVAGEGADLLAGGRVPQAGDTVAAGGGEVATVGGEGQSVDALGVTHPGAEFLARPGGPQADLALPIAARGPRLAGGGDGRAVDGALGSAPGGGAPGGSWGGGGDR